MQGAARCCCGDTAVTVAGAPVLNAICHCASCKQRTEAAFGWNAYFPDTAVVKMAGAVHTYARADREIPFERAFCARCGTTLYWRAPTIFAGYLGVAGGCFVDQPLPQPSLSARDALRCEWLDLPAAVARTP